MAAPYSYTQLQTRLAWIETSPFATRRLLCKSLGGRRLDVLTITEPPSGAQRRRLPSDQGLREAPVSPARRLALGDRQQVVITARVHPVSSRDSAIDFVQTARQ